MPRPRTIKSHLPIQFLPDEIWVKQPKLVHICRDPRDLAVSMFHFVRNMFRCTATKNEFMDEFFNDRVIYCPYPNHVRGYQSIKDYKNILYITYEWATTNVDEAIMKIAKFLEKSVSEENFAKLKDHLKFDSMKSKTIKINLNKSYTLKKYTLNFQKILHATQNLCWRNLITKKTATWMLLSERELLEISRTNCLMSTSRNLTSGFKRIFKADVLMSVSRG